MYFMAWNIHNITGIQIVFIISQLQERMAMQDIHTMLMCMLVKGGMPSRLNGEVAQVEVGRIFILADQYLASSLISATIFWAICPHLDILPAQFTIFYVTLMMDYSHVVLLSLWDPGSL